MTAVSLLSLFHHVSARPCKENRANIAGTVSGKLPFCVFYAAARFSAGKLLKM